MVARPRTNRAGSQTARSCGSIGGPPCRYIALNPHAQDRLGHALFDVAFLDLRLAREKGLDVLPALLRLAPGLSVVVITAYATIETAVEAMRRGAFDYLPKPFTPNQLRVVLDKVA